MHFLTLISSFSLVLSASIPDRTSTIALPVVYTDSNTTISATCPNPSDHRTLANLVLSCLTIIFSCTWVAIHPNIPSPRDKSVDIFLRKVKAFFIAVLLPEWMVMLATRQFLHARLLRDMYNQGEKAESET